MKRPLKIELGSDPAGSKKTPAARVSTKGTPAKAAAPKSKSKSRSATGGESPAAKNSSSSKLDFYLGGYDAKSCPVLVMKNFHPAYSTEDQDPVPPGPMFRMSAGVEFESEVGALWKAALGPEMLVIPDCDRTDVSKRRREKLTLAAIKNPGSAKVIWNARLPRQKRTHRTGEPDALVHWGVDAAGTHLWVPVDVKHHQSLEGSSRNSGVKVSTFASPHPDDAFDADLGAGIPQKKDAFQLAHYVRMLEGIGHAAPVSVGGIVGKELKIVWHQLDARIYDYKKSSGFSLYDEAFAYRVTIAENALVGVELVGPEKQSDCASCIWRTSCHDDLKHNLDHITLVHGVTQRVAAFHYQMGVTRITELAHLDWRTARLVDASVDVPALLSWAASVPANTPAALGPYPVKIEHSVLLGELKLATAADLLRLDARTGQYSSTGVKNLAASIDRARVMKVGKVFLARGRESVGINRSVYEQDFDIEATDGYVYLIGLRTTGRKAEEGHGSTEVRRGRNRHEYDAFVNWDHSEEGEARVFAEFWAKVQESREYAKRKQYGYRLYHYAAYEKTSFEKLATRHAGRPGIPTVEEVKEFFAHKEVIDLYAVLSTELVWPTESNGLKELAKWVRFSWRDSDPSGDNSLAWYRDAISHPDPEVRKVNQQRLLQYNEDDVVAQVALRDWLSRLGESRQPGKKLPGVASLERRFVRR